MEKKSAMELFDRMHPGFFDRANIRGMDAAAVYEEMILKLDGFSCDQAVIPDADGVVFGFFGGGDLAALRESVSSVDEGWVQYYTQPDDVFCAFVGGRVVSFCLLDDMGVHEVDGQMAKLAGPGCVGTIPAFRRKGIGLRMVQLATQILKDRGYDYSYIHYTGVGPWYAKLGYKTLVRWNKDGVID